MIQVSPHIVCFRANNPSPMTLDGTKQIVRSLPTLRQYRVEAVGFAVGFPPFLQLVAHGQLAGLAVVPLACAWVAFEQNRVFVVGLALGSLAFKPQLLTIAVVAALLIPRPRLWAGGHLKSGLAKLHRPP